MRIATFRGGLRICSAAFLVCCVQPALRSQATSPESTWAEAEIELQVPAEAKQLGHHGIVVVEGDVSPEGRATNLSVAVSSRSSLLDDLARTKLERARLGGDLLVKKPGKIRLKVDFNGYDLDNLGLGYLCKQAVLDADWYARAYPEQPLERSKFTRYVQGAGLIDRRLKFAQDNVRFAKAWQEAVDNCRTRPDAPLLGVLILAGNGKQVP